MMLHAVVMVEPGITYVISVCLYGRCTKYRNDTIEYEHLKILFNLEDYRGCFWPHCEVAFVDRISGQTTSPKRPDLLYPTGNVCRQA